MASLQWKQTLQIFIHQLKASCLTIHTSWPSEFIFLYFQLHEWTVTKESCLSVDQQCNICHVLRVLPDGHVWYWTATLWNIEICVFHSASNMCYWCKGQNNPFLCYSIQCNFVIFLLSKDISTILGVSEEPETNTLLGIYCLLWSPSIGLQPGSMAKSSEKNKSSGHWGRKLRPPRPPLCLNSSIQTKGTWERKT